eukprot:m.81120 g.81120  ORF g.81120 m.81120 type:complete len:54 (+) comp14236_c1_seq5:387-548(+)
MMSVDLFLLPSSFPPFSSSLLFFLSVLLFFLCFFLLLVSDRMDFLSVELLVIC